MGTVQMMHFGKIALHFVKVLVVVSIALAMTIYVIQAFFNYDASRGTSFVPIIVGAWAAGQKYAQLEGALPLKSLAWIYAVAFTMISVSISSLIVVAVAPDIFSLVEPGLRIFALAMIILAAISILVCRFIFMFGAKTQLKLVARG